MLVWLAVYLVGVLCLPTAAGIFSALGCLAAALLVGRDTPFCGLPPRRARYSTGEYAAALGMLISGCALLSFAANLLSRLFGAAGAASGTAGGSFFGALVFSCLVPAFFEELLLRGRVLGLLREARGGGVWLCAALFALMHGDFPRLPYAFFAGVMLASLVYLTENLYLGMLFHFLNNFASLLLARLPDAAAYGAAAALAALFCASAVFFGTKPLFADVKKLLFSPCAAVPLCGTLLLYAAAMLLLCVLKLF